MQEELKYGQTKTSLNTGSILGSHIRTKKENGTDQFDAISVVSSSPIICLVSHFYFLQRNRSLSSKPGTTTDISTGGTTKMRLSNLCLLALSAPVVAFAFLPQSFKSLTNVGLRSPNRIDNLVDVQTSWSQDECSFTQLNMAFQSDKESNMFDGPMALTKERDACGVGFVANTKSGGKDVPFE